MNRFRKILCLLLACLGLLTLAAARDAAGEEPQANRVIVLASSSEPGSEELARFYAGRRGVPAANVVVLPMPAGESVGWRDFIDRIYQPLQDELVRRGWIDAMGGESTDRFGRKRYAVIGHRIAYLVVCRGVPWRIENDPALMDPKLASTLRAELRTDGASVDSELSMLAQSGYEIVSTAPNPLFANDTPSRIERGMVVQVARLDGPTWADARRMVDSALEAERDGLLGRGYVDLGGPSRDGDRWLVSAAGQLAELGFDGAVERTGATFGSAARFDAPAFYFGWYADNLGGPFAVEGFRFPPGAIALHIYSFSAAALHSDRTGWCGPLVARGAAATLGNVAEPYLGFTHRPDLLLRALARGWTLGDAAYYALPVLSWQPVLLGDPLYRPFAVPLERQLEALDGLPAAFAPYAVLRRMKLLERAGRPDEAQAAGEKALKRFPNLALALATARLARSQGDAPAGVRALAFAGTLRDFAPTEWPLAREVAGWLAENGARPAALHVYAALVRSTPPTREARLALLTEALSVSDAAGETTLSDEWRHLLDEAAAAAERRN